jgi:hypothetical protein
MKAEFELNIDQNGKPVIKFNHSDKDDSLEQKILGIFLQMCKQQGIEINLVSDKGAVVESVRYNGYEIRPKKA